MQTNSVRILGIDPGTTAIGYALIECEKGLAKLLQAGLLSMGAESAEKRLEKLHKEIKQLIKNGKPSVLAIEQLFFAKNQKTAITVAEARGVILLTTALAGLEVFEYTPLEVKKTITGDGTADKTQIKKMLQLTVPETRTMKTQDDVFDAVAIALTCFFKERHKK